MPPLGINTHKLPLSTGEDLAQGRDNAAAGLTSSSLHTSRFIVM